MNARTAVALTSPVLPANERAIRRYLRAGFRPVAPVQTPDGPALLMCCERTGVA